MKQNPAGLLLMVLNGYMILQKIQQEHVGEQK